MTASGSRDSERPPPSAAVGCPRCHVGPRQPCVTTTDTPTTTHHAQRVAAARTAGSLRGRRRTQAAAR